jgi:hypothetical protein
VPILGGGRRKLEEGVFTLRSKRSEAKEAQVLTAMTTISKLLSLGMRKFGGPIDMDRSELKQSTEVYTVASALIVTTDQAARPFSSSLFCRRPGPTPYGHLA